MRIHTTAAVLLATSLLALTGCSNGTDASADARPKKTPAATPDASAPPKKLEPVWKPKLDRAAGRDAEATAACQRPSSNACARYVKNIMGTVDGLVAAIEKTGQEYPKSLEQIGKMKEAESEYKANGCQGDLTADDPNSLCHGVVGVTIGVVTLGMTLYTDEVGR
ncbi:hypothetical protein AB0N62_43055 [Streptomyces sp. NPDC093982]|uniref:hypothetical protein n=1 Tax=Streptomyces sp. NPDC093982 TaxID=3155077 RepID=UPI00344A4EDF